MSPEAAPYRSFRQAMEARFGGKVYKLALDGGMTCPNRDGRVGHRGCLFCSDVGSGEFAAPVCGDVRQQLALAKARVEKKNRAGRYIAYFQSFTNTYAPVSYLETLFRQAMEPEDMVALSVATRPDCLPEAVVQLLERLNREKPVWVELGLQTIHPATAQYIRRGYALSVYDDSVARLRAAGLEVITHVILGLPGEAGRTWWKQRGTWDEAGCRASSCNCSTCWTARTWRRNSGQGGCLFFPWKHTFPFWRIVWRCFHRIWSSTV